MIGSMTYSDSKHCLLSPFEMGQADALTIAAGTSEIELMGNAGRNVGRYIVAHFRRSPVSILCGPGNNGGDGFVVGCYLRDRGWPVRLAVCGEPKHYGEAATHFLNLWGEAEPFSPEVIEDAGVLVDALFGAGLDRPIAGAHSDIIRLANQTNAPIVSVDMPSGVHGETGQVLGDAIRADATVTFFRKKPGHLLLPGRDLCGEVELGQIGIGNEVLERIEPQVAQNHPDLWELPKAAVSGHKYSKGHCVVVSGPKGATGAARMSALSALRAGAALVTINRHTAALAEHRA
ncbi:NAD(P)H-hydrate epimerase, partial [uncultured Maritalea sp.]|uniref:NAD(P)H-hydrate epimerase n=1 Tax=uncultured Maritalea sp. TaxID=757249 RepID=UPI0026237E9D